MNEMKLIALYFYICERYNTTLVWHCQRFSNFSSANHITDEEILTIYLYAVHQEEKYKISSIYDYAKRYLMDWFPNLPSYQAFNNRINRLSGVMPFLSCCILNDIEKAGCVPNISVLDSMPIITCSGKRQGKVATDLTDKGYCSTKNLHYYGVKLHGIGFHRPGTLPFPEYLLTTPASVNDLTALREILKTISDRIFFADKAYIDSTLEAQMADNNSEILTPVKLKKGESQAFRYFKKAADDLYSTAVSRIRQPIESFFGWLNKKVDIQRASNVRSSKGLIVHIFGRISAALLSWFF